MRIKCVVFTLMACVIYSLSFAQSDNTEFLDQAKQQAALTYGNLYGDQLQLYNGRAYHEILINADLDEGNPFFVRSEFEPENIRYNNVDYLSVPLLYDVLQDQVVTKLPQTNLKLVLVGTEVQYFTLGGHRFIRLNAENGYNLDPGFYDVLYDGTSKVFARRIKNMTQSNHDWVIQKHYIDKTELFLVKDGIVHKVRNKKSILNIFGKRDESVRSVLRGSGREMRKNKEAVLVKIAEAYDTQTH